MSRPKLIVPISLVFLAACGLAVWYPGRLTPGEELSNQYPRGLFVPVPKDFPQIIAISDAPSGADTAEWKAYAEQYQSIREYLTKLGAAARSTEQDRAVIIADLSGKFAQSREQATRLLAKSPDSIPALIALGRAEAFGDGHLPRGLYFIRKARRICESRGKKDPSDADAREWYLRTLDSEYSILAQLDRRTEQLQVVARIEAIYKPLPNRKIWPLIKLRKYDEAAEAIRLADQTGRFKSSAANAKCTLAWEMQDRNAAYEAGVKMVHDEENSPLLWNNFGQAALGVFRFDEAEKAFLKSTTLGRHDFSGTAFSDLTILYLQQGRIAEAIDAMKQANRERASREPGTLQQDQATTDLSKAMLMTVLGRVDDAVRHARSAYDAPNRGGSTSDDDSVLHLSCALAYAAVLQTQIERINEDPDSSIPASIRCEIWQLYHKTRKLINARILSSSLRPYLSGGPDLGNGVPSWLRMSVAQFVPVPVAAEAIRLAREAEDHPLATPYLDAIEAETCLRAGNYADALSLARSALDRLPARGEKLLCGRVALVGAQACLKVGDVASALPFMERALQDFPAAFRLLDVACPVHIEHDGKPTTQNLAIAIAHSRRFRVVDRGLLLSLKENSGVVDCQITGPNGSQILAKRVELVDGGSKDISNAVRAIHEQLFSPSLDLTQSDMSSLDGSPIAARGREVIDQLLKPRTRSF